MDMDLEHESSTKKTILTMLKTSGPLSVSEMARSLGVTEMAVRRHLQTLERDALIDSFLVRQPMGRPTHSYRLTEAADSLFPKNYNVLALDLLVELSEDEGEEKIDRLFEKRRDKLLNKYAKSLEGKPLEDKVALLADIQNANGYMVDWKQGTEGQFILQEFNCPIAQVARQFNQACRCELELFERLLETEVEQTECMAKGGGKCVYVIQSQ